MTYAVLFPGQGSQFVGMGEDLFAARPDLLVEVADKVLGWSLRQVCLQGPETELIRTERAQPALFALAFTLWEELAARLPTPPAAAAGHSLGEYTAVAASGMIDFATALDIVAVRGRAMAAAADLEPSGMAALLGVDDQRAETIAADRRRQGGRLWVANLNAPGQVVVAGAAEDLAWLEDQGRELGVRRVVPLKVAGAFHTPLMEPATSALVEALGSVVPGAGRFPVWANVDASPVGADRLAATLVQQVVSPVRFSETLAGMAGAGIDTFVHVGPGDVTAGMAKRSAPGAEVVVVSDLDGLEEAVAAMRASSTMGRP